MAFKALHTGGLVPGVTPADTTPLAFKSDFKRQIKHGAEHLASLATPELRGTRQAARTYRCPNGSSGTCNFSMENMHSLCVGVAVGSGWDAVVESGSADYAGRAAVAHNCRGYSQAKWAQA